jgi:aryl sulfotransferase
MTSEPARRAYRTWILDSARWDRYRPRPGDVVIATYPKCGTTWMQQIVGLLVFQSPEPRPVMRISPWIDRRFPPPAEAVMEEIEAQAHRRFLKSHLPFDGLPIHDEVRYIHVARDGRDACMSYHNHCTALVPETLARLDQEGLQDPTLGRPYPRPPTDPAAFFRTWISQGAVPGQDDGLPFLSFFRFVRSWWEQRARPNLLLVHYNDLTADLDGEMRRVADFLGIPVPASLWPELVAAAGFEAMRREGATLMDRVACMFEGGADRFLHRGTNGRWRGALTEGDLDLYAAKVAELLPPTCAGWVAGGRVAAGEPRSAPD